MSLQRFVDVGDSHGALVNVDLREKFFAWLDDFKPDIAIHGGDAFDFTALRKKASDAERQIAMAPDIEEGKDFLKRLFSYGSRRFFTRGNHDERIYDTAHESTDAAVRELAGRVCREIDGMLADRNVVVLPYNSRDGVLDIEGIRAIHGYASGVGAARKFASVYGSCAFHHTHTLEVCPVEHFPDPSIAIGSGCMMNIDQHYNAKNIGKLRHENGWLYGYTDGRSAVYFQARYKHGDVYVATGVKSY